MREFLAELPQVQNVYYPDVDGRQLRGCGRHPLHRTPSGPGSALRGFVSALRYFGSGTGMACVTSMIAQPYTGSHASMTDAEKDQMGLSRGLVRLCFGLEEPDDLRQDLRELRLSVGLEHERDLISDLEQALAAV